MKCFYRGDYDGGYNELETEGLKKLIMKLYSDIGLNEKFIAFLKRNKRVLKYFHNNFCNIDEIMDKYNALTILGLE